MGWKQNSCTSSVFLPLFKSRNGLCQVKGMSKIQSNDLITYMGLTDGKMETCEVKIKEGHRGSSKSACWCFCLCATGGFWFIRKDSFSR